GEQLDLARAVHGDEPPSGFVDGLADGEQAVIAEDGVFVRADAAGDAAAFENFFDDAGEILENDVIFVKRASILRERIEQAADGGPRFTVERVSVGGRNDIGARGVDARVDGEGCEIDFRAAFDDIASVIHEN